MRVLVGVFAAASWLSAPAQAEDVRVAWPTYFRTGPSQQHQVVGELARGTILDVQSCNADWCRARYGRTIGYVARPPLNSPPPASPAAAGDQSCFLSTRAGHGEGQVLRFCPEELQP